MDVGVCCAEAGEGREGDAVREGHVAHFERREQGGHGELREVESERKREGAALRALATATVLNTSRRRWFVYRGPCRVS
jgi:hypothetical protein